MKAKWMQFALALLISFGSLAAAQAQSIAEVLGNIPVQDGGRKKPFDTFARESLQLIYGRRAYKKIQFDDQPTDAKVKSQEISATETLMTWLLVPEVWDQTRFIKIDRFDLKETLKLEKTRSHFTPTEVMATERLMLLFQDLQNQRTAKVKLNPYWQAVQSLENALSLYKGIVAGASLKLVPKPKEMNDSGWFELRELPPDLRKKFDVIAEEFAKSLAMKQSQPKSPDVAKDLKVAVDDFVQAARAVNPESYADSNMIHKEYIYNDWHPFQWAWGVYAIALIFCMFVIFGKKAAVWKYAILFTVLGFLIHSCGFGFRVYLTGRPPVSNMYETVIWVSWGAVFFALIFEQWLKKKFFLMSALVVAVLCLIVADISPTVLDPSLQPLEPVLRSNFWLVIHVMTISISYSAFFLAFILGDIGLAYFIKGEAKYKTEIQSLNVSIYRTLQVGIVLLFSGTVLGGIWADYSWGRFWGWDPKETWAFIALMGYLAVLHGRLSGWLNPFRFMCSAIVAFSLVLMAWYGVNFVLGAGLHSYGFGAGGVEYVTGFVALHFAYVIFAATVRQSRLKA
jgi:cytochrome c-type biogenesis protein CcsB